ncbi:chemotaxis protein CheW [Haloarcula sp. JP-L23]|uniref:chemotaxis protein CheW n=1 Tax=Haloarcula sp. JP-L23 TaxID=2716717 RepID=UPI00140F4A0F|nr:purine-binding chemotaxis protein CheW [Haloarcula sp. JP-L23]
MTTRSISDTQIVEFKLGIQTYCVDIQYVTEVANLERITPIPNSESHVRGLMDLRGRTTSVCDPKVLFDIENTGDEEAILVFDADEFNTGSVSWVVDEITQVTDLHETDLDEADVANSEGVRGVISQNDNFIIWVDPSKVMD